MFAQAEVGSTTSWKTRIVTVYSVNGPADGSTSDLCLTMRDAVSYIVTIHRHCHIASNVLSREGSYSFGRGPYMILADLFAGCCLVAVYGVAADRKSVV